MNTLEAYKILDLNPNCSLEEAKKKHKELVKKYHPDLNKDVDPQKMKDINEAFDSIKKHKETKVLDNKTEDIIIHKTISYANAIYGTNINIEYERVIQCNTCDGNGEINECEKCNGLGFIMKTIKQQNTIYQTQTQCKDCINANKSTCNDCFGSGLSKENKSLSVKVPPGINNNSKLVLRQMGNFTFMNFFSQQMAAYKDAFVIINYQDNPNFKLKDQDLHTNINVSFLEYLTGFEKEINLPDNSQLNIKANSQEDYLTFKNLGLARKGNLIVNIIKDKVPENKLEEVINILNDIK